MPHATKRSRRRKRASPFTFEELEWLRQRRPLWSKEASDAFEHAGKIEVIEPPDSAAFLGTVSWPKAKGRPRKIDPAVAAQMKVALAAAVEADESKKLHKNAVQFVDGCFKKQGLPVPPVGQLNRAIIWDVNGKTKRPRT
jgi:hypothetical protein